MQIMSGEYDVTVDVKSLGVGGTIAVVLDDPANAPVATIEIGADASEALLVELDRTFVPEDFRSDPAARLPRIIAYPLPQEAEEVMARAPAEAGIRFSNRCRGPSQVVALTAAPPRSRGDAPRACSTATPGGTCSWKRRKGRRPRPRLVRVTTREKGSPASASRVEKRQSPPTSPRPRRVESHWSRTASSAAASTKKTVMSLPGGPVWMPKSV